MILRLKALRSEMAIRICESLGRAFTAEQLNDEWLDLRVAQREASDG